MCLQQENMKRRAFQEVRLIIYAVLIGNGIFVQYFSPLHYMCDYEGYSCSMCGMRTAIDCLTKLQFREAFESNRHIIILLIIGLLMLLDSVLIIKEWSKNHKKLV